MRYDVEEPVFTKNSPIFPEDDLDFNEDEPYLGVMKRDLSMRPLVVFDVHRIHRTQEPMKPNARFYAALQTSPRREAKMRALAVFNVRSWQRRRQDDGQF